MSAYFEIAYAAAAGRLCFFTGTGFSKAVTANAAPSWQGLLDSLCDLLPPPTPTNLKTALFPGGKATLPLEEAAQVISIELDRHGKSIHEEIANLVRPIQLVGDNKVIEDFIKAATFDVVTTNYDKLFEQFALSVGVQSITPGLPIPRSGAQVKVYHVHGSIDSPRNMVVTSDDYFRFLNSESYFAKKLSTILHENTVVILGYSLGDTNLKTILSDYKGFSKTNVIGGSIFLVSRDSVGQHIKDYYSHCFSIRVIDDTEVHSFFSRVLRETAAATNIVKASQTQIQQVLSGSHVYSDDYLKVDSSFYEILSAISAIGAGLNNDPVVKLIASIIQRKTAFTNTYGAWEQYAQLARWLVHLAAVLDIRGTALEGEFLAACLRSMQTMSRGYELGQSWAAYHGWSGGWRSVTPSNRTLIRGHILANAARTDAQQLVNSI